MFFFLVSVVAETEEIQALLRDNGVEVQTVSEVQPIQIMSARILSHIYVKLGKDSAHLFVNYFTIDRMLHTLYRPNVLSSISLYSIMCVWEINSLFKIFCFVLFCAAYMYVFIYLFIY